MREDLSDYIRRFNNVPPSHHVLARLRQVIADQNSDLGEIASVIKVDSSLATSVMRLSNSAYFGTPVQAESVEEAISLLGSREVYKLAAFVAILDMVKTRKSAYPLTSEEIWRSTVLTAIIMDQFAPKVQMDNHTAYTVGLVHSTGKWIFSQYMEVYSGEVDYGVKKDFLSLARWERETFDTDHAKVGAQLLEKWIFTEELILPVRYQLDPLQAPDHLPMACLLRTSLAVAARVSTLPEVELPCLEASPEVLTRIGLSEADLIEAVPKARKELVEVYKLLRTI